MIRVVKVGGRAQASPDLADRLGSAWKTAPGSFCVIHGGGDEISAFQRRIGLEPSFVGGRRITTRDDIDIVRMVLSGLVNKRLVSSLVAVGVPAVGISGEDGGTLLAAPIDPEKGSLGRVGKPIAVNASLIQTLLDAAYLPVISPLAADDGSPGEALNVNGDDAAAAIAIALGASELLLIADVTGVLDAGGQPVACLDQAETLEHVRSGVVSSGMRAKLEAGFTALTGGVGRVRITSLDGLGDPDAGTLLAPAQSLTT